MVLQSAARKNQYNQQNTRYKLRLRLLLKLFRVNVAAETLDLIEIDGEKCVNIS